MQNIQKFLQKYFTEISFVLAILFFLIGGVSLFFTKQAALTKTVTHKAAVKISSTPAPTAIPTTILGASTQNNSQVSIPTNTPIPVQNNQTNNNPTPTHSTGSGSSTSAPPQQTQQTVNLQISEPDGTFNFTLPVGGNACDELTEAKNEGKIKSVSFSNQYMSSMHSLYVTEINSYQNNWTFTVNGQGPAGCSLASPKAGDNVVWRFS